MRTLLAVLLSLVVVACAHSARDVTGPPSEVHCELLALDHSTDEPATASFRVTNKSSSAVTYQGYAEGQPLYQCEVLEAGVWQASPLGWCGTGLEEHVLGPGGSLTFDAMVPRDGKEYRFRFGDPSVSTPPVRAPAK